MQLIGYFLLVVLAVIWMAIINFCFTLINAASDLEVYTGIGALLLSIPAMVKLGKSIIKLTKLKE